MLMHRLAVPVLLILGFVSVPALAQPEASASDHRFEWRGTRQEFNLLRQRLDEVAGRLLLAVVLVPVFWTIEHKVVDPIIRPALLAPRQLRLASAISFGA